MLCIGGEEKQKDIKKGNELPFLISFSFLRDLRSHTGMREMQLTIYRSPYSKFSERGPGGSLSAKERFPHIKTEGDSQHKRVPLVNHKILNQIKTVRS